MSILALEAIKSHLFFNSLHLFPPLITFKNELADVIYASVLATYPVNLSAKEYTRPNVV
jgi:hypothetical protein